jgi:hypothetical protein
VVGDPHADAVATGSQDVGNRVAPLDDHGDGAREKLPHERDLQVGRVGVLAGGLDVRHAEGDGFLAGPSFQVEHAGDRVGVGGVRAESVDRLGRVDDDVAVPDFVCGGRDVAHRFRVGHSPRKV